MEAGSVDINVLREKEEAELKIADIACRKLYVRRVVKALRNLKHVQLHERDAEDIVSGKKSVDDILQGKGGEWEGVIRNACTEYQGLTDLCFLLVCAPKAGDQLTVTHDEEARRIQLDHFYQLLSRNKDKKKYPKDVQVVATYDCLKGHIDNFMQIYASKSKRAMIVFNGHGSDSGGDSAHLSFTNGDKHVTNSDFLQDVYFSWNKFKENHNKNLDESMAPSRVTVVLAHCFGYKHKVDEEHRSVIEVACLTNEHNPETRYVYNFNTSRTKIKESMHLDLINFARSHIQEEGSSSSACTGSTRRGIGTADHCVTNNNQRQEATQAIEEIGMTSVACLAFSEATNQESSDQWLDELTSIRLSVTQKRLTRGMSSSEAGMSSALRLAIAPFGAAAVLPSVDVSKLKPSKESESDQKRTRTVEAMAGAIGLSTAVGGPSCSDDQTRSPSCSQIDGSGVRPKNLTCATDLSIPQSEAENTHDKSKKKTCFIKSKLKNAPKTKTLPFVTQLFGSLCVVPDEPDDTRREQSGSITDDPKPEQDSP